MSRNIENKTRNLIYCKSIAFLYHTLYLFIRSYGALYLHKMFLYIALIKSQGAKDRVI